VQSLVCRASRVGVSSVTRVLAAPIASVLAYLAVPALLSMGEGQLGLSLTSMLSYGILPLASFGVVLLSTVATRSMIVGLASLAAFLDGLLREHVGEYTTVLDWRLLLTIIVASGVSAALIAYAIAGLTGGYLDSVVTALRSRRPRGDALSLALSALSIEVIAYVYGWPMGAQSHLRAAGALAAGIISGILVPRPLSLVTSILAGYGWIPAVLALSSAALSLSDPPSCRGMPLVGLVAVSRYTTAARSAVSPRTTRWSVQSFECTKRGSSTGIPTPGGKGLVLWVYGQGAKAVIARSLRKARALILCLGCDHEYWASGVGAQLHSYTIGEEAYPGLREPGSGKSVVLVVEGRSGDYAYSVALNIASRAGGRAAWNAIIVDSLDSIGRRPRYLEAILAELLSATPLVVALASDPESHGMGVKPRVRDSLSAVMVGGVRDRYAADMIVRQLVDPAISASLADTIVSGDHVLVFPVCGGSMALLDSENASLVFSPIHLKAPQSPD